MPISLLDILQLTFHSGREMQPLVQTPPIPFLRLPAIARESGPTTLSGQFGGVIERCFPGFCESHIETYRFNLLGYVSSGFHLGLRVMSRLRPIAQAPGTGITKSHGFHPFDATSVTNNNLIQSQNAIIPEEISIILDPALERP